MNSVVLIKKSETKKQTVIKQSAKNEKRITIYERNRKNLSNAGDPQTVKPLTKWQHYSGIQQ